jgi:hypothetical protein
MHYPCEKEESLGVLGVQPTSIAKSLSLWVWTWEGKKSRSPDTFPLSNAGLMAEMMADGVESVEADMSLREVEILEIRRREMVDDAMNDYQGSILTCTLLSLDFDTLRSV